MACTECELPHDPDLACDDAMIEFLLKQLYLLVRHSGAIPPDARRVNGYPKPFDVKAAVKLAREGIDDLRRPAAYPDGHQAAFEQHLESLERRLGISGSHGETIARRTERINARILILLDR